VEITTPTADEMPLVYDAWANSYRKSPWAGTVPNHLWDSVSRESIKSLLSRGARVLVAVTPVAGHEAEYPAVRRVMGYSVSEPSRRVLHWLFVKEKFRRVGIGRALLDATCPDGAYTYTHRTRASSRFLGERFTWDPVPARVK
jgi:GNAT superfamily N-acetyltransferase